MATNPLKEESTMDKVSKIFKKSDKKVSNDENNGIIRCEFVGSNRAIDIIAEACACCWDKKVPDTYEERCEYVAKRTRTGHTSILEHSNFSIYFRVTGIFVEDMINFLSWNEYCHVEMRNMGHNDWRFLMSGSLRGFSFIYTKANDLNNAVLKALSSVLYLYAPSAAFEDICKQNLMNLDNFAKIDNFDDYMQNNNLTTHYKEDVNEHFEIVGLDGIQILYTNLMNIDPDFAKMLKTKDLLDHVTVTVLFKNMSRIITQQQTRHRNGITQESQRYVNYTNIGFNSPALFKDKIDPDHKYNIRFGPSSNLSMTLQEIGDAIVSIYGMLYNPVVAGKYALVPEDARAFLPNNAQSRKLYMTFTYSHLFKYFLLREHGGAQAEIRMYAKEIAEWVRNNTAFCSKEITDLYTMPKLLIEDPFTIDVDEGIVEEVMELTEDDYIKASGLDKELDEESKSEVNK